MTPNTAPTSYQRLARSGSVSGLGHSLWCCDTHLLQVQNQYFSERYQRFHYADIQALVVQATPRYHRISRYLGFVLLLSVGAAVLLGLEDLPAGLVLAVPCAMMLAVWLANLFRGPTCVCYVQTAVQTERLHAIERRKAAQRLLAVVEPLVTAAQGPLSPEQAQEQLTQLSEPAPPVMAPPLMPPLPAVRPLRHCTGAWHRALALLFFGDVLWSAVDMLLELKGNTWDTLATLYTLAELLMLIATLIYQAGTDFPVRLKRLTWALFVYGVVTFTVAIGLGIAGAIAKEMGETFGPDRMVDMYFNLATILFLLPGGWVLWNGVRHWRKN